METSILKGLLRKEFYDDHRGSKCPTQIFSKPAQKIKLEIDRAMDKYHRDLTAAEIEGLFFANNPTLTSAQKVEYKQLFHKIDSEPQMGSDVAQEVLSKMFQQYVGEEVANIGFDFVNGSKTSLEPLRRLMEKYNDDFTPTMNVEWDAIDIDSLLQANDLESRWKFNIPTLAAKVDGCNDGHLIFVGARPNTGKCQSPDTPILMANGTVKLAKDVVVGDVLAGPHRNNTVLSTTSGTDMMFKVEYPWGESYTVNAPHILSLKRSKSEGGHKHGDILNVPVQEYIGWPEGRKARYKGWKSKWDGGTPVQHKLHPYLLGAWLGDGTTGKPQITTKDSEVVEEFTRVYGDATSTSPSGKAQSYYFSNGFLADLREAGVADAKSIPDSYLRSTLTEREQLLAGLLDTDGYCNNCGWEITQSRKQLAEQIVFLARSVGLHATLSEKAMGENNFGMDGTTYYRVLIGTDTPLPVRAKRHIEAQATYSTSPKRKGLQFGFSVTGVGEGEYVGWELDGDKLYMLGDFTVTHNTSFHASLIAGPNGFAHQGAKCVVLCNEEAAHRVAARYLTAATGMTLKEIKADRISAEKKYAPVRDNIFIKDSSGRDMAWVESVVKTMKPDIVILDMGDKFATFNGYAREDQALGAASVYARAIGKQYGCAVFYMSQLSAEAEGKATLNQSMMNGSKTGKAAEADLMILIGKDAVTDGMMEESPQRYLNIAKNKLTGWHGMVVCMINAVLGRYEA